MGTSPDTNGEGRAEGDAVIWTPDRRLRVFLSSTLGELADERRAVTRAISALRLAPVLFELGARPHPPRDLYRAYGDDDAARDASERLTNLLDEMNDPFLHAVSLLALAWSSPLVGESLEAETRTARSLEELHGQDEPYWTALTAGFLGSLETLAGRYDDALVHLLEMREIAVRFEIVWLAAWAQSELAILAVKQDRLDDARRLLDEGLGESLASGSTRSVSICVAAFAQLMFKQGAAERAALLSGAAEGLRQRTGLRVWPCLREEDERLRTRARAALGVYRFDRAFAAGTRLSQREAVALVREKRGAAADAHPLRNA